MVMCAYIYIYERYMIIHIHWDPFITTLSITRSKLALKCLPQSLASLIQSQSN